MRKINIILTCFSLSAVIVILERISPTSKILLQPYNFIAVHELDQSVFLILISVITSCFILKTVTNNFQSLKEKKNQFFTFIFISGIYLFGVGEGWHEISDFMLHQYCKNGMFINNLCGELYINDYFTGNIIFFVGGVLMNTTLLALGSQNSVKSFNNKDLSILLINSLVYAFTWFAYAAFDKVLVGLFFSLLLMIISIVFLFKVNNRIRSYPYITYSAVAYILATVATILFRFH